MLPQFVRQICRNMNAKFASNRSICNIQKLQDAEKSLEKPAPEHSILVEKDTSITLIGINRGKQRNSVDSKTAKQMCEAFTAFEEDETSPVAVLYGIGGSFCAGHDLESLEQQLENKNADDVELPRRHLQKPIVCGISGFCVGLGLELALMCDLRVMEDSARLGFFNRRYGVPISRGSTVRLAAAVGSSRALDLILTGRRVGAEDALQMGLINRLVATGTSLGQAVNLAFSIAKYPLASLQHDRKSLHENVHQRADLQTALQNEGVQSSARLLTEMQEGVMRFRNSKIKGPKVDAWHVKEKTIPDWEKEEIAYEKRAARRKHELEKLK